MFKMRTNTIKLYDQNRFINVNTGCQLCDEHIEDLQLETKRMQIMKLQRTRE